jgi:chaperonin cofactor prefoldin
MSNNNPSPDNTTFGERMGIAIVAFLRALLGLLVIAILAAVVGAAIYYGLPAIYDRYVQPIQMDVSSLQVTQADQEQAVQQLSKRVEDLTSRINTLEVQSDSDKQTITELQTQLSGAISTQTESLVPMQNAQATATSRLDDLDRAISELEDRLTSVDQDVQSLTTAVDQNQEQLAGLADKLQIEGTPLETIRNELQMVKVMELLTRSRLLLVANNLGLAQQDLQSASDLLNELQSSLPDDQKGDLGEIIDRLDKASSNLPNRPVLASDDLEIAWRLLLIGLPDQSQTATAEVSGTPGSSSGLTTPSPEGTVTGTPGITATPTSTPTPTP